MPNPDISRQSQTVSVSTTYSLTDPNINQVICNATSSGFTVTIYDDLQSGAYHRLVVAISDADVSGNTVTIVNAGATFSTSLDATSESVTLETTSTGAWIIASQFSTTQAATASSKADSAGLRASSANSAAGSAGLGASTADSKAVSDSINISVAGSGVTSNSINISVADSKPVSDSVVISTLTTTTNSKDTSQSVLISSLATTTNSAVASLSLNLSTTTSTANSG